MQASVDHSDGKPVFDDCSLRQHVGGRARFQRSNPRASNPAAAEPALGMEVTARNPDDAEATAMAPDIVRALFTRPFRASRKYSAFAPGTASVPRKYAGALDAAMRERQAVPPFAVATMCACRSAKSNAPHLTHY